MVSDVSVVNFQSTCDACLLSVFVIADFDVFSPLTRGDMPLWGAALALIEHPVRFLALPYYHASHVVIIKTVSRSGFFRKDIPHMFVFSDAMSGPPMNTRITS